MSELNHPILVDKQLEQQLFAIDHKKNQFQQSDNVVCITFTLELQPLQE
jgi:hypothetical protein